MENTGFSEIGDTSEMNRSRSINSTNSVANLIKEYPGVTNGKTSRLYGRTVSESSDSSRQYTQRSISESSDVELVSAKQSEAPCISRNKILIILVCVFTFSTLTMTSLLVTLWVRLEDVKARLSDEIMQRHLDSTELCFPCAELKLGPFPEDNARLAPLSRRMKNGEEECCSTSAEQTSLIFDLIFEKKQKIQCTNELIQSHQSASQGCNASVTTPQKPSQGHMDTISAHLLAGTQQKQNNGNDHGPTAVRNWSVVDPIAHVHGLTIMNDRIRVNASGLYFIYSQVYFVSYPSATQNNDTSSHALYHFVYRFNVIYPNGGEELLLKGVRTKCWSRSKAFDDYTSYTAAVIHLNANDEIYVKVSNVTSISRDSKATFLGMFRIS